MGGKHKSKVGPWEFRQTSAASVGPYSAYSACKMSQAEKPLATKVIRTLTKRFKALGAYGGFDRASLHLMNESSSSAFEND